MANLYFEAQLDADQLKRELRETRNRMNKFTKDVQANGAQMDSTFKRVGAAMAGYFSITAAKGFLDQVIQVRGEFQQLDIAMQTMLGSKAEADKLMAEVVELAAKTPFSLTELGQGAKRLLAFKEPTDRVGDSLRRLGDLAAGASVPVTDLIQAYGKVSAKGKMQAEELNQFAERGIPIISELAKVVGATDKEIYKMAEQGKIGFEELRQAILNMTDEGGQFFNLMEKQSGSLTGQISNLGDAWDRMLNEIGQDNEGIIYSGIDGLKSLVENYETVIDVLKVLVATYGAYKAVLVLTWAAQKAMALGQTIRSLQLMTKGINSATRAQVAFNTAAKANPWGLLAAGIAAVVTILPMFKKEQEEVVDITKDATEQFGKEKQSAEALFEQLKQTNSGSEKRARLIKEINSQYGTNLQNLQDEKKFLNQIEEARQGVIDKLKEEMILKSERIRIEENLSQQQVQKGLISMTEAEIQKLESLGSPQAVEAARKRLKGQQDNLNDLKDQLKQITKETAEQLDELFGSEDSSGGGRGKTTPFDAEAFKKSLSEQKKAYEQYNAALRSARDEDKEAVKDYYSDLLKQGEDYEQYLIKQLEAFRNNVSAKVAIYQAATAENIDLTGKGITTPLKGKGISSVGDVPAPDSTDLANLDSYKQKWEEAGKALQSAFDFQRIDKFGNNAIQVAYTFQDIASSVGQIDKELGDAMMSMADAVGQMGNALKAAATGDYLTVAATVTSSITNSITKIVSETKKREQAERSFYQSINSIQNQYILSLNEQLRLQSELADNVFTTDYEGKLRGGIEALNNASEEYRDTLSDLSRKGQVKIGVETSLDLGKLAADSLTSGNIIENAGNAIASIFGGGNKSETKWGNLLDTYTDLTDEAGNLNLELARAILSEDILNDETKELLQTAVDWTEQMEAAQEQIRSVISDLAGGLGDDLRNALVSAFEDGTDAAAEFGESVEKTLEDLLSKMIFQQVFGNTFDQLQKEMESSYGAGGDQSWMDDFARMFEKTSQAQDEYSKALEEAQKQGEKYGFSLFDGSASEDPLTGAVKGVTEETASLIGGQMNAIRINQAESLSIMNESVRYQAAIAANTANLSRLETIENILSSMNKKSNSDPLKAKGL
jgi:tape measure domain-containing protein